MRNKRIIYYATIAVLIVIVVMLALALAVPTNAAESMKRCCEISGVIA